jgi:phosphoribosylformimino-5-aminoimidazole carboxamide ribotide isomerase
MKAIPAINVREGACVQLVGGAYENERVRLPDPLAVAEQWARTGFSRLHVVDLDAATGRGSNLEVVKRILEARILPTQVGGGIRSEEAIAKLLALGADQVVVGTRAVEDAAWRTKMANKFPGKLIVAADVRERRVVTRGWQSTTAKDVLDFIEECNALPLGGILVTAVHLEGMLQGPDLPLMEKVTEVSRAPVQASGGVSSAEDLRELQARGISGAIIGMALYTGTLDVESTVKEFGA